MNVYIDVETIPGQAPWIKELTDSSVSVPGSYKKPEAIQRWWDEKGDAARDKAWTDTSLNATFGEAVVISWAIEDEDPEAAARPVDGSELNMLQNFFDRLDDRLEEGSHRQIPVFIGHNVLFDIRFLWRRAVILELEPPFDLPYDAKPWGKEMIDTCQMWKQGEKNTSGTLDVLCKVMGLGEKEMGGDEVWQYMKDGRLDEVVTYCKGDVNRCRALHQRMTFA